MITPGGGAVGANAEIFVFDDRRYRDEVVPTVVELLRTGAVPSWLDQIFRSAPSAGEYGHDVTWPRLAAELRERPTDLARHCTWLGPDLRYVGGDPVDRWNGTQVRCRSLTCPERERCRLHRDNGPFAVEELNRLHEALVATRCLGPGQFLARSITPHYHLPVLERQDVPAGDPLRGLLAVLATRGAAFGYQYAVTEGIHGWLTASETVELADRLDRLDLPRYEPTLAAMAEQWRSRDYTHEEWQEMSLSFVRTMAVIAADSGQGVLWGNDVSPEVWREMLNLPA